MAQSGCWTQLRAKMIRWAACALPVLVGVGAAVALLWLASRPARPAEAANTLVYPGCAPTIQQCLNIAAPGDSVVITAGTYITSLTLSRAVSLTGVASNTTILRALPNSRVLTITGAAINSSVVISGLTFRDGSVGGSGGGLFIDGSDFERPQLTNIRVVSNSAQVKGGGLYVSGTVALRNSQFLSNTSKSSGGGAYINLLPTTQTVILVPDVSGGLFTNNYCTNAALFGGGCSGGGLTVVGPVTLAGTQFISNSATSGGGGASAMAVTMDGGLFQDNSCTDYTNGCSGGGLASRDLRLTGTTFLSNTAFGDGGGAAGVWVTLSGGLFQDNVCTNFYIDCLGGGIYAFDALTLTGTLVQSNFAGLGAGAWVSKSASLQGGSFVGNYVLTCVLGGCQGGGLYAHGALSLTGTLFTGNQGGFEGGGIYVLGPATLLGGQFQGNTSSLGGGLYANGALSLTGTLFTGNQAAFEGGGIYVLGPAMLLGGQFQGNTCSQGGCKGGALFAAGALDLTGTRLLDNAAGLGGGLYVQSASAARIVNALFAGNRARTDGGALALETNASAIILDTTIATPTLPAGGSAIAVFSGTVGLTDTIISNYAVGISRTAGAVFEDYNLFFGVAITRTAGVASGGHSLSGDPAFRNAAAGDYHLTVASAALGKGTDAGVPLDFEGDPRPSTAGFDIGFDEFIWSHVLRLPLVQR